MRQPENPIKRVLLFSYLLLVLASVAGAAETSSQPVQVKIGTILASNQSDEFDARLVPVEKQLKLLKYRSHRLLKEQTQSIPWHGTGNFEIPGGRTLTVSPQELRDKQVVLQLRLQDGQKPVLDTTVKLPNKGNFILGGPPYEGGALVLLISATAP